tara:strand:- start:2659 stop:3099 length:441 start_codon:yes stop_codon:yes gene_type:complete
MTEYIGFNISMFNENKPLVSNSRILAQNYIDNGVHPSDFKNGKLKNEIILEYNRRKIIIISHILKSFKKNQLLRIKHFMNLRTKKNNLQHLLNIINNYNYTKLDKLHFFLLEVSKNKKKGIIPKSKSSKISMKMGPNRKTRKRKSK